eukprot:2094314-Alexandrium_andersonii.AAC.1
MGSSRSRSLLRGRPQIAEGFVDVSAHEPEGGVQGAPAVRGVATCLGSTDSGSFDAGDAPPVPVPHPAAGRRAPTAREAPTAAP